MATQVDAGVRVIGGLAHEMKVNPGNTYEGIILLANDSEEPQEVKVYQTDYLFFCDGTNKYGEPGKLQRSNANWITFKPERLIIPGNGTTPINYTIKVPDDTSLIGTYWSMLMVEGIGKGSPESIRPEKGKVQLGIRQVIRYGIQVVSNIGETGSHQLEFIETKLLAKEGGGKFLQIDIENTGEWIMIPMVWAEIYDEEGRYIGNFESSKMRIYPGTSVRHRIDLSDVPKGRYKALIIADAGGDYIFGASYTLEL
jgi:hypothetical protein